MQNYIKYWSPCFYQVIIFDYYIYLFSSFYGNNRLPLTFSAEFRLLSKQPNPIPKELQYLPWWNKISQFRKITQTQRYNPYQIHSITSKTIKSYLSSINLILVPADL